MDTMTDDELKLLGLRMLAKYYDDILVSIVKIACQITGELDGQYGYTADWIYGNNDQAPIALLKQVITTEDHVKASPVDALRDALIADSHYADTWHANLAMVMQDYGMDYTSSQDAASQFMRNAFGIVEKDVA